MSDPDRAAALARLASRSPVIVATDYDGVISPIVADPAAAEPDPEALTAFLRVSRLPGVIPVVVSGRSRRALVGFLGEPDGVILVGNHGADVVARDLAGPEAASGDDVDAVISALTDVADRFAGTLVEPKPHGAALHYRNAADREGARDAALAAAAATPGRVIAGKEVVEVVLGTETKGTAIERLRRNHEAAGVLYLGDDVTDEDVFVTLGGADVGIRVGDGPTAATHRIDSVAQVAAVFDAFADGRSGIDQDG